MGPFGWIYYIIIGLWVAGGAHLGALVIGWIVLRRRTQLPFVGWGLFASVCLVILYGFLLVLYFVPEVAMGLFRSDQAAKMMALVCFSLFFIGMLLNIIGFLRLVIRQDDRERPADPAPGF